MILEYFTIRQGALNDDVIDPSIMEIMNKETQPVVKEMSENRLPFGSRKTGNYILIQYIASDALKIVPNTVCSKTLLSLVRFLMHQTLCNFPGPCISFCFCYGMIASFLFSKQIEGLVLLIRAGSS